jgi:hypothetical protein
MTIADGNIRTFFIILPLGLVMNIILQISTFHSTDILLPGVILSQFCERVKVSGPCSHDDCGYSGVRKRGMLGEAVTSAATSTDCTSLPYNRITTKAHNLPNSVDMQS